MSHKPPKLLLQNPSSAETRAALTAAMLSDTPVVHALAQNLAAHASDLRSGALPVGSVEFVQIAMRAAGIPEPDNLSYLSSSSCAKTPFRT